MATVKDELDRTVRGFTRVMGIAFGASVLVGLAWGTFGLPNAVMVVSVGAFAVGAAALLALHLAGVRCPRCSERLEWFYRTQLFWWSDIRYCPRCGLDFQTPADNSDRD
jgi:hypothetical protein